MRRKNTRSDDGDILREEELKDSVMLLDGVDLKRRDEIKSEEDEEELMVEKRSWFGRKLGGTLVKTSKKRV